MNKEPQPEVLEKGEVEFISDEDYTEYLCSGSEITEDIEILNTN